MPLVPSYNSNIQEQGIPSARIQSTATAEAFGGGKAGVDPFKDVSETAVKIAYEEKKRYDQVAVQDYDTQLSKLETDIQTKASQMKGKDALGVQDFIDEEWQKGKSALDETLNNDQQRAAAHRLAGNRYESLYKFGLVHSTTETARYEKDSTDSAVGTYQNEAALNYQNPERIKDSLNRQVAVITDYASKNGLIGSPQFEEMISNVTAKTHEIVLHRMIDNGQDRMASEYFNQVKDHLGDRLVPVEKLVEDGSTLGSAQRNANDYITRGLTSIQALDEISKIEEPKLQKATRQEYELQSSAIEKAQKDQQFEFFQKLSRGVEISGTLPPQTDFLKLSLEQRNAIYSQLKRQNENDKVPANGPTYQKYLAMATTPETRNQFTDTNIFDPSIAEKMTKSEFEDLKKKWSGLREKDSSTTTAILDYMDANEKIKRNTLKKAGIDFDSKNYVQEQQKLNFDAEWARRLKQKQDELGRDLNSNEVQEIADNFATQIVIKRGIFGNQTDSLINITPQDIDIIEKDLNINDIPVRIRERLAAAYKKNNVEMTDEALKRSYIQGLREGKFK